MSSRVRRMRRRYGVDVGSYFDALPRVRAYQRALAMGPAALLAFPGALTTKDRGRARYLDAPSGDPVGEIGDPLGGGLDLVSGEYLAGQSVDASRPVLGAEGVIFDGSAWLNISAVGDISTTLSHAVAIKFTRDDSSNIDRLYEIQSATGTAHFVQITDTRYIRVFYEDENGDRANLQVNFDAEFPVWETGETKMIVGQYNAPDSQVELWVDGALVGAASSETTGDFLDSESATIGAGAGGGVASTGTMYSLVEYIGTALTSTEIAHISELLA